MPIVADPRTAAIRVSQKPIEPMSFNADEYISDLQQTVTAAGLNYEIWWTYKSEDTRPKFVDAMNGYSVFFQTSIHAHFVALLVALYRLYETRADTFNIPSLLRLLRSHSTFDRATLDQLDAVYAAAKSLWVKVSILRNKAFGHRSRAHTVAEVFQEAAVSPNELKELIEHTMELLNLLTRAWDRSVHAFNLGAKDDLVRLLNDISRLRGT
jgi:HEPN superfamily AbiU2-like protein